MKNRFASILHLILLTTLLAGLAFSPQKSAYAAASLTVQPITWNIIGLDSNNVNVGPNHFPIGARVCNTGDTTAFNVRASFVWDTANPYINLRPGTAGSGTGGAPADLPTSGTIDLPSTPGSNCKEYYFEVEVTRNAAAYDTTRRYHIAVTADGGATTGSTPTPRELYVEHLVSQSRNAVTDVQLNGVSIPAGGTMTLAVGNTYTIKLVGFTATQGYNQLESFINFPNTIFQVNSVSSIFSAGISPISTLYADACGWDNVLTSPTYRSCIVSDNKSGGNVTVTYNVTILKVPGAPLVNPEPLSTLLYDFSGSSYHYNSDYGISTRYAQIIDPSTAVTIAKAFSPSTIPPGGSSTLTVTLTNTSSTTISGANFSDTLPLLSGSQMVVATPAAYSASGCGSAPTLVFAPVAGASSFSVAGATLAPNGSCTLSIGVSVPATPTSGSYQNTITDFRVGASPTSGITSNTANLTVNTSAGSPGTGICGQSLAQWTFPTGFSVTSPAPTTNAVTAVASLGAGIITPTQGANDHTVTPAGTVSWGANGNIDSNTTTLNYTYDDYFQFALNTTGYTSLNLTFYAQAKPNNGPQGVAVYSGSTTKTAGSAADPGTQLYSNATLLTPQNTWYAITLNNIASFNPSGTTYFRIYGFNSNNISNGFDIYLDDVNFTGCGPAQKPTLTKTFNTNPVAVGGTSTLSFTITNPNPTATLNAIQFSDVLPAGLTITNSGPTAVCGGSLTTVAATGTITFTGEVLAGGASCTITTPAVTATTAGPHPNVSGFISSTESGTNSTSTGSAKASLVAVLPPTIEKVFSPNPILPGQTTTLTFTITNPNPSDSLPSVAFTDTFPTSPAGMVVAATPNASNSGCGTPTFAPVAGAGSISFSNGTLVGGGTCTVKVDVTVPAGTTGDYVNTTSAVTTTIGGLTRGTDTASSTLTVNPPHPSVTINKQVSSSASGPWSSYVSVPTGATVYYRLVVENTGDVPLSNVSVTDPLLTLCTNAQWLTSNASWPTLPVASPTQDPTATCIVSLTSVIGNHPNTATVTGLYNAVNYTNSDTATYVGVDAPTVTKAFSPNPILIGGTSTLTITIANPAANTVALTGVSFTDTLTGMQVAAIPNITTTGCGTPTFAPIAGATTLSFSGGTVAVNTTCTITVDVTAAASGAYPNTVTVSASNSSASTPATATLNVNLSADLGITKTDNSATYIPGTAIGYTVVVTNSGPNTATGATVADTIPGNITGATWTCAASAGATCTASGNGNINDTVTIPSGGSLTYTVIGVVSSAATGNLSNAAAVTVPAGTTDPVPGNNTATDTDTLAACTSGQFASWTFTGSTTNIATGAGRFTYDTIGLNAPVWNTSQIAGDYPAISFTGAQNLGYTANSDYVDFAVPTNGRGGITLSLIDYRSGTGPTSFVVYYSTDGSTYTALPPATVYAIANGAWTSRTIDFSSVTGLNNNANARFRLYAYGGTTAAGTWRFDNVSFSGNCLAYLTISKTDGIASLTAGTSTTYTIRATNNGLSSVTGAILSDPLVAGLTKTAVACSATPGQCTVPTTPSVAQLESGTFALPVLGSGEFYEITVTADLTATSGTVANAASIAPPTGITNPGTSCVTGGGITRTFNAATGTCASTDTNSVTPTITSVDDTATTPANTPATTVVTTNDTNLGGTIDPNSVTITAQPAAGTGSVTCTGASCVYTPPAGYVGTTSYTYQVCLAAPNDAICDTAVVTVTVTPTINAVDDDFSAAPINALGGTTASIIGNDTTNGVAAVIGTNVTLTPGSAPTPAAGSLTMNANGTITVVAGTTPGTYSYPYNICTNPATIPATCDTANATVVVVASTINAVNDTATTSANTPVTTVVTTNDTNVGGSIDPNSVTVTAQPSAGTGSVVCTGSSCVYTPPAGYVGTATYTYQVCLAAPNASVCDTATVTVAVNPTINAVDDDYSATPINGGDGGTTASIITNDTTNGVAAVIGTNVTFTPGTAPTPTAGSLAMNADGTITVAAGTTAGTYAYPYTICTNPATTPATCDTANTTIVVTAPTLTANDDPATTLANTPITTVVTTNDTNVGGSIDPNSVTVTAQPPAGTGTVTCTGSSCVYTPPAGYVGTTTYTYQVCLAAPNASICDTATVTVTVTPTINAVDDDYTSTPINGGSGGTTASVIDNDTTNGVAAVIGTNVTLTPGAAPTPVAGSLTMNADGTITVAAGTTSGTYTYPYTICTLPATTPATCDTATATVVVAAATINAVNDTDTTPANTPVTTVVITNDTNLGGSIDNNSVAITAQPAAGTGSVVCTGASCVYTPPAGYVGTATYTYQVCLAAPNGSVCDTATVTITVTPTINAVDDDFSASPLNGGDGGTTATIITNDTTNGVAAVIGTNVTLTPGSAPTPVAGSLTMNANGTIIVAPGTTAGTYTYPYTICTNPATTPATCDTANATIVVTAPTITAIDDTDTTPANTPVTTVITTNDTNVGGSIDPASVTITAQPAAGAGSVVCTGASCVYTPSAGYVGIATYTYQVCLATPNGSVCDTALVTVTVNPTIDAVNDDYTASPILGTTGGTTAAVIVNDTTNGVAAVIGTNVALTPGTAPTPAAGSITMNANGTITVAAGTTAGTYTYPYTICTLPATTPATCDTANATVVVTSPAIDAVNDNYSGTPISGAAGGNAGNAFTNDTLNGAAIVPAQITATINTSASDPGVTLNTATGSVDVALGTPTGIYTIIYQICENINPKNCDTATVTVVVSAPASISGVVYNDANLDGSKAGSEAGLAGVTVQLYDNTGTTLLATTTTAAGGTYSFPGLTPGSYRVVEIDPAGYVSSTANSMPVTIAAGGTGNVNFGDYQLPNTALSNISGVVFDDANGNGIQDGGELPLNAVTVELRNNLGTVIGTTTTNALGAYSFTGLPAGTYTVVETDLPGYVSTTLNTVGVNLSAGTNATVHFGDQVNTALIADPAVTKFGTPTNAVVGDTVVYTITVGNNGNTNANNVVLTDTKPAFLDIISITISPNPGLTPVIAGNTFTINFGTVTPTDFYTVTVLTRVNALGVPPGGANTVRLATSSGTDRTSNNTSAAGLTIPAKNPGLFRCFTGNRVCPECQNRCGHSAAGFEVRCNRRYPRNTEPWTKTSYCWCAEEKWDVGCHLVGGSSRMVGRNRLPVLGWK
ncbi:MAG: SdrD B-like domain-containing protein [Anaerolineales bacterium]